MDLRNYQTIQEAYLDVYSELDEATRMRKEFEKQRGKHEGKAQEALIRRKLAPKDKQDEIIKSPLRHIRGSDRHLRAMRKLSQEQVDLYDLILSHLLDEGYAETPEAAEVMMVNMSEEWRESIMERRYGEDEKLPGSGLTPKQKYRRKHKQFLKKSADKFQGSYDPRLIHPEDAMETGRQRAQRMAANYGIGATR